MHNCSTQSSHLIMDTNLANLSIFSNNETFEFEQIDDILCLNDVSNSDIETEFNTDNIDGVMTLRNYFKQFLEPSYCTHSSTQEELKNKSRAAVESMPCAEGSRYTADVSSLNSDHFMEIDPEVRIFQNHVNPNDLSKPLDEKVSQMSQKEIQEYFDVQEEIIVEEYLKQEINAPNQDINQYFDSEQTDKTFGRIEKEVLEEAYKCKHCELSFKTTQKLKEHTKQHSNKQSVQKNILEESKCLISNSSDELTDYVSEMEDNFTAESYLCKICNNYCKSNADMVKHLRIRHTSSKNCLECNIHFDYSVRLTIHMNTHKQKLYKNKVTHKLSTENSYPCDKCDKVFKSKSSLMIHMRLHTGKQIYNCAYCDKIFAYCRSHRKHERIHIGENPYACPVGPKTFEQKVIFHERTQKFHCSSRRDEDHGQFDFHKCQLCRTLFRSSSDLYTHLKKHHDENTAKLSVIPSLSKQQYFVIKDGNCSGKFSTELNPIVINSDILNEPEDLESVEKLDLAKTKTEPNNNNKSVFPAPEYKHLWNLNHVNQVKYYRPNNYNFYINEDVTLGSVIDDCLIEG